MSGNREIALRNNMEMDNVLDRIPPEIWIKIFKTSSNRRHVRTVCEAWRAIVDENIDMRVRINDDQMDVNKIINFHRVVQCTVFKFVKSDFLMQHHTQIFWNPKLLSSLRLTGTITKPNFMLIAKECQNVKQLLIRGHLLTPEANIFNTDNDSNEEKCVISNFLKGLEKLVVCGLLVELTKSELNQLDLCSLLQWPMNKLKTLVLRANFLNAAADKPFVQLLEKYPALEHVEFKFYTFLLVTQVTPIVFVMPNLSTFIVEVRCSERLFDWLPFLAAQTSIKHLKLVSTYNGFRLGVFEEPISGISKSLQSLEFGKIDREHSVQFLGELSNLKSLILIGDNNKPRINHLSFLPISLQNLVLESLTCDREEMEVISRRVVNIKTKHVKL